MWNLEEELKASRRLSSVNSVKLILEVVMTTSASTSLWVIVGRHGCYSHSIKAGVALKTHLGNPVLILHLLHSVQPPNCHGNLLCYSREVIELGFMALECAVNIVFTPTGPDERAICT
ncbi:hypothetical protein U0070_009570 [Myodes glareolus]|uniref:Uncharacterized protein n=1 Tax=Myodes glareolus TaxID=447135 RepID=A0AAW0IVA3_MYOGA